MGRRAIQLVRGCDAVPCDPKDQVCQNDNGHRYCERAQGVCQNGTGADGFLFHGIAGCEKRAAPPNGIVTVICISRHERRRRPTINCRPRGDECPASAAGPLKGAGSVPPVCALFLGYFLSSQGQPHDQRQSDANQVRHHLSRPGKIALRDRPRETAGARRCAAPARLCARATTGHAATPPRAAMKVRRLLPFPPEGER
jgi:hypothetical protein